MNNRKKLVIREFNIEDFEFEEMLKSLTIEDKQVNNLQSTTTSQQSTPVNKDEVTSTSKSRKRNVESELSINNNNSDNNNNNNKKQKAFFKLPDDSPYKNAKKRKDLTPDTDDPTNSDMKKPKNN